MLNDSYMKKRHYLALDLKDDLTLIEEYENHHAHGLVWPEIIQSIRDSGITDMEIYRVGNRMVMMMEVDHNFDFDKKANMDINNPEVQKWEELMWKFQQPLPWAKEGEKWMKMDRIFKL